MIRKLDLETGNDRLGSTLTSLGFHFSRCSHKNGGSCGFGAALGYHLQAINSFIPLLWDVKFMFRLNPSGLRFRLTDNKSSNEELAYLLFMH